MREEEGGRKGRGVREEGGMYSISMKISNLDNS